MTAAGGPREGAPVARDGRYDDRAEGPCDPRALGSVGLPVSGSPGLRVSGHADGAAVLGEHDGAVAVAGAGSRGEEVLL